MKEIMSDETVTEIFNGLPAVIRAKLNLLMTSGMDSTAAYDSLSEKDKQIIEEAVDEGVDVAV